MRSSLIMISLALSTIGSAAFAHDGMSNVLGGAIGGAAGAVIGDSVGGRNGAIVGGALGAATGVAIARPSRPEVVEKRVYVREERRGYNRHWHHKHRGHGYGHRHHDRDD